MFYILHSERMKQNNSDELCHPQHSSLNFVLSHDLNLSFFVVNSTTSTAAAWALMFIYFE